MTLDLLPLGQEAVITAVGGEGTLRQHFLDMGVIPGASVKLDSTSKCTCFSFASSTERSWSTLAPMEAITSISL